jgi:hypothetical protein
MVWHFNIKACISLPFPNDNGKASFFAFSMIAEGTTEMVLHFTVQHKSVYSKTLCFIEQKMYF